jgi:predicted DNA-binding antitoxin AbrB/MazE fold protein
VTITIRAVYENGVLRPDQPLELAEGEAVQVTVTPWRLQPLSLPPPTPEQAEALRRISEAKTLDAMWAALDAAEDLFPSPPDGYDLLKALDENRKFSGWYRPLTPPAEGESGGE